MKISLSQTAVYNKVNHEIYRHFTKVCFVKFWFCWLWFTSARGDVFNSLLVVQCLVEINVVVVEKKNNIVKYIGSKLRIHLIKSEFQTRLMAGNKWSENSAWLT